MRLPKPEDLRLVLHPDPILRKRTNVLTEFPQELEVIARRMLEIMREHEGVGLAAPQVGLALRLFVCNVTSDPGQDCVFINPAFESLEGGEVKEEGCLSLPEVKVMMRRATRVVLRALDVKGRPIEATGEGLVARVWQHETDHLDGRLIIDNMSTSDELANRRALKQMRKDYTASRK